MSERAITVGELKEKLEAYDNNLIVCVMRDADAELYPITVDDWRTYGPGEVFFPNTTVSNEDQPAIRIGMI